MKKFFSHLTGLFIGIFVGLVLIPFHLIDTAIEVLARFIEREMNDFSFLKIKAGHFFPAALAYLASRPLYWLVIRPLQAISDLIDLLFDNKVIFSPIYFGYKGAKGGFTQSLILPLDWFMQSSFLKNTKLIFNSLKNGIKSFSTKAPSAQQNGRHSPVFSALAADAQEEADDVRDKLLADRDRIGDELNATMAETIDREQMTRRRLDGFAQGVQNMFGRGQEGELFGTDHGYFSSFNTATPGHANDHTPTPGHAND